MNIICIVLYFIMFLSSKFVCYTILVVLKIPLFTIHIWTVVGEFLRSEAKTEKKIATRYIRYECMQMYDAFIFKVTPILLSLT